MEIINIPFPSPITNTPIPFPSPTTTGGIVPSPNVPTSTIATAPNPNNVIPFPTQGNQVNLDPNGQPIPKPVNVPVTQAGNPTACETMSRCMTPVVNNAVSQNTSSCSWTLDRGTVIGNQATTNTVLTTINTVQLVGIQGTITSVGASVTAGFTALTAEITALGASVATQFSALSASVTAGFTAAALQLTKFATSIHLDKVLNFLTFILSLHNALQLSRSLATSIGELLNSVLSRFNIKDENGDNLNITDVIGDTIENTFKGIVGLELYTQVTRAWAKGSAIWTSTSNILDLTRNMMEGVQTLVEIGAQTTNKIGNALKKSGVILEDSFDWLDEKINARTGWFKKFKDFTQGIQEPVDTMLEVSETIGEIGENWNELKQEKENIETTIATNVEDKKTKEDDNKTMSTSPVIQNTDLDKPDP